MTRLLILSCSRQKRAEAGTLPAIERYDGPAFRVVRKFLRQHPQATLEVWVLSARSGLIPATHPMPHYDQRMTPQRAAELAPATTATLHSLLKTQSYKAICLCMGRDYAEVLNGYHKYISSDTVVTTTSGAIGKMLANLYDWLYGVPPALPALSSQILPHIQFRGLAVVLTADQVMERARQAIREERGNPTSFQAWYVEIDEQRVAPKWVVSVATGVPVSDFTSSEARRILHQLGLEVRRR